MKVRKIFQWTVISPSTKLLGILAKIVMKIGKLTTGFAMFNAILGLAALIWMMGVGETGSAKIFFSCAGVFLAALFNVLLAIITGLSFKDEQKNIGKIITVFAEVNIFVGLAPLIGIMIVGETGSAKIFYSCAGMFFATSFDALVAIMAGFSLDIPE